MKNIIPVYSAKILMLQNKILKELNHSIFTVFWPHTEFSLNRRKPKNNTLPTRSESPIEIPMNHKEARMVKFSAHIVKILFSYLILYITQ